MKQRQILKVLIIASLAPILNPKPFAFLHFTSTYALPTQNNGVHHVYAYHVTPLFAAARFLARSCLAANVGDLGQILCVTEFRDGNLSQSRHYLTPTLDPYPLHAGSTCCPPAS
jgi:hypothetical protein